MKILILYAKVALARRTYFNFAFTLVKNARENDYVLHCYGDPVPEKLKAEKFDAIVFDPTFLATRTYKDFSFDDLTNKYNFIKESEAIKIALPQDDYCFTQYLIRWYTDWKIDAVLTPFFDYKEILYPSIINKIEFQKVLTGYVDDEDIKILSKYTLPFEDRKIDVGFRATIHSAYCGYIAQIKSRLGENFEKAISKLCNNLKLDISNKNKDVIYGEDWLKFLGNIKFSIGCEGGSSLLDNDGSILRKINSYIELFPQASFEEIKEKCFPNDDKYKFLSISPRIFESAIAKNCQILLEGKYDNIIKPGEHYILLKSDFSNIEDVLKQMSDTENVKRIIDNCYNTLIASGQFHYRYLANQILDTIKKHQQNKNICNDNLITSPTNNLGLKDLESLITGTVKLTHFTGYGYIPSSIDFCNFENIIDIVCECLEDQKELFENKIYLRTGKLGAVREFLNINKFLEF